MLPDDLSASLPVKHIGPTFSREQFVPLLKTFLAHVDPRDLIIKQSRCPTDSTETTLVRAILDMTVSRETLDFMTYPRQYNDWVFRNLDLESPLTWGKNILFFCPSYGTEAPRLKFTRHTVMFQGLGPDDGISCNWYISQAGPGNNDEAVSIRPY